MSHNKAVIVEKMKMHNLTKNLAISGLWLLSFVGLTSSYKHISSMSEHTLSDNEYKYNMGDGYVFFEIDKPQELSYTYKMAPAMFSASWNVSFRGIGLVKTSPLSGCGYITNRDEVEGNIAFMERGECSFVSKALRAEEAGAVAVIISDMQHNNDELFISMADDQTERDVKIPSGYLLGKNGYVILRTLEKLGMERAIINIPINITMIPLTKLNEPPWMVW